jgi:hypothetical protein
MSRIRVGTIKILTRKKYSRVKFNTEFTPTGEI